MKIAKAKSKSMDTKLAKRLVSIVVTDFLCWFPVGLLGLLAWRGMAVPGEVNVAVVTFVMPLNSALNPFLYTLNVILEKRQEQRLKKLTEIMERRVRAEYEKKNVESCYASKNVNKHIGQVQEH